MYNVKTTGTVQWEHVATIDWQCPKIWPTISSEVAAALPSKFPVRYRARIDLWLQLDSVNLKKINFNVSKPIFCRILTQNSVALEDLCNVHSCLFHVQIQCQTIDMHKRSRWFYFIRYCSLHINSNAI